VDDSFTKQRHGDIGFHIAQIGQPHHSSDLGYATMELVLQYSTSTSYKRSGEKTNNTVKLVESCSSERRVSQKDIRNQNKTLQKVGDVVVNILS
jgi:hypothetical protein